MSVFNPAAFTAALPLETGLMDWTKAQRPDMWHEIALHTDFRDPRVTIDLLLTLNWITLQPACDRATALVILTRAVEAGLHGDLCPVQLVPEAARTFTRVLHAALAANCFLREEFALTGADHQRIDAALAAGIFALPDEARRTAGRRPARAPYAFDGFRPRAMALPRAA